MPKLTRVIATDRGCLHTNRLPRHLFIIGISSLLRRRYIPRLIRTSKIVLICTIFVPIQENVLNSLFLSRELLSRVPHCIRKSKTCFFRISFKIGVSLPCDMTKPPISSPPSTNSSSIKRYDVHTTSYTKLSCYDEKLKIWDSHAIFYVFGLNFSYVLLARRRDSLLHFFSRQLWWRPNIVVGWRCP